MALVSSIKRALADPLSVLDQASRSGPIHCCDNKHPTSPNLSFKAKSLATTQCFSSNPPNFSYKTQTSATNPNFSYKLKGQNKGAIKKKRMEALLQNQTKDGQPSVNRDMGGGKYTCQECGYRFSSRIEIRRHIQIVHTDIRCEDQTALALWDQLHPWYCQNKALDLIESDAESIFWPLKHIWKDLN